MKKIEKILAPTDLSSLSCLGLEYALELARGWGASVTVLHVADASELANYKALSLDDLIKKHESSLDKFLNDHLSALLPLVEVKQKVLAGPPAATVIGEAQREGTDLIVMSTHGRTGVAHMLMGSVTEQVVRTAVCPVFTVHPPKK